MRICSKKHTYSKQAQKSKGLSSSYKRRGKTEKKRLKKAENSQNTS